MVRTVTRRSTRTPSRKPAQRTSHSDLDPKRLPYAGEAQAVTDIFNFLTRTLPDFIDREFQRVDCARNESELYRALASLPDSTLRKAGLRREDLPRFVLSAFHLVNASKRGRARSSGRPGARSKASGRQASATPR